MRPYFSDLDETMFNTLVEKYRKGVPKSPLVTPDHIAKRVAWMNLGAAKPISVKYEDVVAPELAKRAAAELLKQ